MSLSRKISSALTYNAFRVVISVVLSIAYSVIAVRWLQIQNLGGYIFLDSVFSILATIYVLGTHEPLLRFIPEFTTKGDHPKLRRMMTSLQKINLAGSCTAAIIIILEADVFFSALGRPELAFYAKLMALGIIPRAVLGITKNMLNALYEQKFLSLFETFFSAFELLLLIIFVVILDLGLFGMIMISLVNNSTATILYSIYVRRKHVHLFRGEQSSLGKDNIKRIIKYTTPLTALDLIGSFLSSASNIFLGALKNLEDVFYFDIPNSFANRVFSQAWLVIGAIGTISLSEISYSDESKFRLAIKQYVKVIALYALPVSVGGVVLAEPILLALYGEKVLPSVQIFRILLMVYCPLNILAISSTVLKVREKTYILFLGGIARSAMITILGLWLIPHMGAMGATISVIISSAVVTVSYAYITMVRDRVGNFLPFIALGKYLTSSTLMGVVLTILSYFLREKIFLQLAVALAIGPLIYIMALRLTKAFDQTDKRMLMNSKVPLKSIILKILFLQ